jgi:hypothetical protein
MPWMFRGVAGWNITIDSWLFLGFVLGGFGTLLGPEETPLVVFFLAAPGLDRLTHPGAHVSVWVGVVVVVGGLGCGCVLSVA